MESETFDASAIEAADAEVSAVLREVVNVKGFTPRYDDLVPIVDPTEAAASAVRAKGQKIKRTVNSSWKNRRAQFEQSVPCQDPSVGVAPRAALQLGDEPSRQARSFAGKVQGVAQRVLVGVGSFTPEVI